LDHFKHINDTLGHAAGDLLLQAVADRLRDGTRPTDFTARLGGDEFAIIVQHFSDEEQLQKTGDAIAVRLNTPVTIGGRVLNAGVSIGGALFPQDATTALELFNNADTALYARKRSGRGGLSVFRNQMRHQAQCAASQLSLAQTVLRDESIVPHYQPKVDLRTGEVTGYEALLRWIHPTRGVQGPDTVEEAFKDYELASRIGDHVRRHVLADIRQWHGQGLRFGRVAINAAPVEFLRDDYAECLLRHASDAGVPASFLEVEVTEPVEVVTSVGALVGSVVVPSVGALVGPVVTVTEVEPDPSVGPVVVGMSPGLVEVVGPGIGMIVADVVIVPLVTEGPVEVGRSPGLL
ncbi:MAG: diguanylate cyclase, partial [Oxalobacteraceae bacterium]